MMEFLTWVALPVLAVHIGLDLFDKHRHGIRVHDAVGVVSYLVLALHFGLDIMEVIR